MTSDRDAPELAPVATPPLSDEAHGGGAPAWEQIEPGRFMPRRIRGSFRGGKLG
jgi:hypothetical protein